DNILGKDAAARYRKDFRADLRSKNKSGTLAGAQDVSSYAAGTLLLAGAQARLNQIEKRLAELNKWKPSVWDYLGGPGWLLWKKWSNDREKAKLLTEKGQIEKTIESLKAAQAAAKAIAGTALTLPPPPGTLEEASTEAPGGESAGAGSGAAGAGRAGFEPGPGHAGIPAGSINGHPLEWGR
ncbi:MAG: hypothetical protein HY303_12005, partial [Candidatus Wallbacteria bacterium]|nr:hypothetical protein [Candidatus Wallbacteria bacterium]